MVIFDEEIFLLSWGPWKYLVDEIYAFDILEWLLIPVPKFVFILFVVFELAGRVHSTLPPLGYDVGKKKSSVGEGYYPSLLYVICKFWAYILFKG